MTNPASASVNATLATFLPKLQLRFLEDGRWTGGEPRIHSFFGCVLVFDISGFTELTAQFEQRGKSGAEQLSGILRNYFSCLTDIIMQHGGDVITFAGDAALAVWPALEPAQLASQTCLAVQAALTVRNEMRYRTLEGGVALNHRAAIAAGELHAMLLGGTEGKRLFLLAGEPLRESGDVLQRVATNNVALGASGFAHVANMVSGKNATSGIFVVETINAPQALSEPTITSPAINSKLSLQDYVPAFVADRIVAGLAHWLAEFRTITVLFIGFPDFDASDTGTLPVAIQRIEQILQHYEGATYQFLMDDKGLALIAAFGLPPRSHEDDPQRGVLAAVEIETALKARGIRTSIGIATGSSFCGIYGSDARRQYTALGRPMNIAARLMQAASGAILCDLSTTRQAQKLSRISFQQLDPLQVKGSSAPLVVYRPVATGVETDLTESSARQRQPLQTGIVGRRREREALAMALDRLQASKAGSLILLEGEAGIGKSRLIGELLQDARARQLTALISAGQAIESPISYHAWRPIFSTVFGLSAASESLERRRQRVLSQLPSELVPLTALMNAVLPFEFPETDATRELRGEARADATRNLWLAVLKAYSRQEPMVLVLDDAHWFDSASWGLARLVGEQLSPALVLLATRPIMEAPVSEYDDMLKLANLQRFALDPLSSDDVLQLVCQRLGVKAMLQPIAQYVLRQTQGNPLFIEELVYALRDSATIEIRNGECRLGPQLADSSRSIGQIFEQLHLPETVQGIITSRVDCLSPSQQMVVKVASVIGRNFSLATLHEIHPAEAEKPSLPKLLDELQTRHILQPLAANDYEFRHPLIQEVVYDSIPFAMRRQLHQATAEWYERAHHDAVENHAALLAQHWSSAAVIPKAIHYSALAGEQALRSFAILEAVRFLANAIALDDYLRKGAGTDPPAEPQQRAHWELQLGSAYVSWSKYEEATEHLERGLALAGHPMPASALKGVFALLLEVMRQIGIRLRNNAHQSMKEDERSIMLELTRAYEGLMEIYYLSDKPVPCLYSVFRGLNLAEPVGPSPELARCYSSTAALLGFMSFAKWADAYFARAISTGEQARDSSALAWVFMAKGVYLAGLGQQDPARENLLRSIELYDRVGDSRRTDDARANLAATFHLHGRFAESLELVDRIYQSALTRRDSRVQAEATRWRAYNFVALGRYGRLRSAIDELDSLRSSTVRLGGFHRKQDVATLTALLRLNSGDYKGALESATAALQLLRNVSDAFEFLLEHAALAEVCLTICESDHPSKEVARSAATNAVMALRKYSRMFPAGRPALLVYSGRLMSVKDQSSKGLHAYQECLKQSELFSTPFYAALAHAEIARQLPPSDATREQHIQIAQELFRDMGAVHLANSAISSRT